MRPDLQQAYASGQSFLSGLGEIIFAILASVPGNDLDPRNEQRCELYTLVVLR